MLIKKMKPCLPLAIFLALTSAGQAANTNTIVVNTTDDENGTNPANCSLREALHVINDKAKKAWGGCPAGANVANSIIQLGAGSYVLSLGELVVLTDVTIAGVDTIVKDDEDTEDVNEAEEDRNPYTGVAPYRKVPVTIIDAGGNSRIISTLGATGSSFALKDVRLTGGNAAYASNEGNGGAVYSSMSLTLDNVVIDNSDANGQTDTSVVPNVYRGGMGGAVFLSTADADLVLSDASLRGNMAAGTGGAVAMVCNEDLDLANHSVSLTRSLLAGNESARGAGAIEACGRTTLAMATSTLSANISAATYAAVTYRQTGAVQGAVSANFITAAEHATGAVFAFSGLSSIALNNSLIIGNPGGNCVLGSGASFPSGTFNAVDDTSCDGLLVTSGSQASSNKHPTASPALLNNELLPLGIKPGWLTAAYVPALTSANALDAGAALSGCSGATDQRDLPRTSGSACDIGAIERQAVTSVDDTAESEDDTNRLAIIDVLDNDSFGEGDGGPNAYADPDVVGQGEAVVVDTTPVIPGPTVGSTRPVCVWHNKNDAVEKYRNRLVVDNGGEITPVDTPLQCTYKVRVVPQGLTSAVDSAPATISASIKNASPNALKDVFVRPVGTVSLLINPLANDNDDADGTLFVPPQWAGAPFNPIYISTTGKPQLGKIEGATLPCPDNSSLNPKDCYAPPLKYVADNPQSPFSDTFTYYAYDKDGGISGATTVTIKTDAPDPDKGETGGSLDLAGGLLLLLLGLRRARKL